MTEAPETEQNHKACAPTLQNGVFDHLGGATKYGAKVGIVTLRPTLLSRVQVKKVRERRTSSMEPLLSLESSKCSGIFCDPLGDYCASAPVRRDDLVRHSESSKLSLEVWGQVPDT